MMHPIMSPYKKYYAVLKIDIFFIYSLKIEEISNIKISNTSINRKNIDSSFKICNLVDILNDLNEFLAWDLFNNNMQFINSEKNKQKGAEILIPKRVAPQYILEICPKCSEWSIKQKYNLSEEIISKMRFNNEEFEFKKEEKPELIFNFNEENDSDDEFNDFFSEEEEEDDSDDWNKFKDKL